MSILSSQLKGTEAVKRFVSWLITQPNSRGSLYLERVARQYARYLCTHPSKLNIVMRQEDRNVFACKSVEAFECLYKEFLSAPNFKDVNVQGHQSFSAGLAAYKRYVQYIEHNGEFQLPDVPPLYAKNTKLNKLNATSYIPKQNVEGMRPMTALRDGSARFAQQNIRDAFRTWLAEHNPEWSNGTIAMYYSDAYYLYNNARGISLEESLTADS